MPSLSMLPEGLGDLFGSGAAARPEPLIRPVRHAEDREGGEPDVELLELALVHPPLELLAQILL